MKIYYGKKERFYLKEKQRVCKTILYVWYATQEKMIKHHQRLENKKINLKMYKEILPLLGNR